MGAFTRRRNATGIAVFFVIRGVIVPEGGRGGGRGVAGMTDEKRVERTVGGWGAPRWIGWSKGRGSAWGVTVLS